MQGNFLVFAHASPRACPRRIGSYHHAIGAYEAVSSHHALGACVSRPPDARQNRFECCTVKTAMYGRKHVWGNPPSVQIAPPPQNTKTPRISGFFT